MSIAPKTRDLRILLKPQVPCPSPLFTFSLLHSLPVQGPRCPAFFHSSLFTLHCLSDSNHIQPKFPPFRGVIQ